MLPALRPAAAAVCSLAFTLACAGDGSGLNGPDDTSPTLSGDVQPILSTNCALSGCHAGASPAMGMNLGGGQAYANTVGIAAQEVPGMSRIAPGNPDQSYLVHKIQGTQATVQGSGQRMPLGAAPLTAAQIETIRRWITAGAPDN